MQPIADRARAGDRPAICIVQPRVGVLTETFIEAHFRHLTPPVSRLECDPFPTHSDDGDPLFSLGHRAVHRMIGRIVGLDDLRSDRALARRLPRGWRNRVLTQHLRRMRVGVVLAEYGPTGVAIREACVAARIPMVVHFHGYDAYKHTVLTDHRRTYRQLFADATAIVAVSRHMQSQLIRLGAPSDKVMYNPYGIDVDQFRGTRPDLNPGVFLAVGRFVEKKAPDLTIRAFAAVAQKHSGARLVMIGDGPLTNCCKEIAASQGLSDRIDFTGPLCHEEVARHMASARCLVQHSVTPASGDREGTPLAILEAMASGLPVVATRHGGIIDVVKEGRTGFLVDEGDVRAMASAMTRLLVSTGLAAELGRAGREFLLREHTIEKRIGALEEILLQTSRDSKLPREPQSQGRQSS